MAAKPAANLGVVAPAPGLTARGSSWPFDDKAEWNGEPLTEFCGLMWLWRRLEGRIVPVVIDVGTGSELTFPDNGSTEQHCFEPHEETYKRLINYERPHVRMVAAAVGAQEQQSVTLFGHGETLHHRKVLGCNPKCHCRRQVPMMTLDRYADEHAIKAVGLLNVSASGHERDAIQGAKSLLQRTQLVIFEYGGTYPEAGVSLNDVYSLLNGAGFRFICLIKPTSLYHCPTAVENGTLSRYLAARSKDELLDLWWRPSSRDPHYKYLVVPTEPPGTQPSTPPEKSQPSPQHPQHRFEHVLSPAPLRSVEIRFDLKHGSTGFNLCLLPAHPPSLAGAASENGANRDAVKRDAAYVGALRRTRNPNGAWSNGSSTPLVDRRYPESENIYSLVYLDHDFRVLSELEMRDISGRISHRNFRQGIEDARLVPANPADGALKSTAAVTPTSANLTGNLAVADAAGNTASAVKGKSVTAVQGVGVTSGMSSGGCGAVVTAGCLYAVTLDTNADWRAEMSLVRFDESSGEIRSVVPLRVRGIPKRDEKNWLLLRHWGNEHHLLYSTNPLCVIRIDAETCRGTILKSIAHPRLNFKAHGGAAVRLPDGRFLVLVRVFRRIQYVHSRWIVLNDSYDLVGISLPFRFQNGWYYEMCMSLIVQSATAIENRPTITACLSLEDRQVVAKTYALDTILESILPISDPRL
jgi:FkbM family methyltransferase